jgi:hypothetical protein
MSSTPRIMDMTIPDVSPLQDRDARARAWRYIFQCHARKTGDPTIPPDGVMKGFGISEKEKGGEHVEHLPDTSSGIVH